MELSGSLKRFPVTKVLQFLNMDQATGVLSLKRGKGRITISIDEGNIIDVEDHENTKEGRMQSLLVRISRISDDQFGKLIEERRSRLEPIGTVLIEHRIISPDEHHRLCKLVYTNILMDALSLNDGNYEFERIENLTPTELSDPISTASVMLNTARQEDEWPTIKRYVPHSSSVFGRATSTHQETWDAYVDGLMPDEQRIVRAIDGISTVREIADNTFSLEFDIARMIADLVKRGLALRMHDQEARFAEARPKGFFSFRLSSTAVVPIIIATFVMLLAFAWKNYAVPAFATPDAPLIFAAYGGKSGDTVNHLRLMRLQVAFYTYMQERGTPPTSLAELARLSYCKHEDLKVLGGGNFVLKILGAQENLALISAFDIEGNPMDELRIEMTIR